MSRMLLLVALGYSTLFVGCHRIAPYEGIQGRAPEAGAADAPGQVAEGGRADALVPVVDGRTIDGGISPSDSGRAEAGVDPCQTSPQDINAGAQQCSNQCVDPAADPDCDGVKSDVHPVCNELLFAQSFAAASMLPAGWTIEGAFSPACDGVQLSTGNVIYRSSGAAAGDPHYLLEVLFNANPTLGWQFTIFINGDLQSSQGWACRIEQHGGPPTLVVARVPGGPAGCIGSSPGQANAAITGTNDHVLQLIHDNGGIYCRLLSADGMQLLGETALASDCATDVPGGIYVQSDSGTTLVKYVRAFDTP